MTVSSEITRKAKSNLAFALNILPKERRDDMVVFYAFCRVMDDLADSENLTPTERISGLEAWKAGILDGFEEPDAFQQEVISLRDRNRLPRELLVEIIDGCEMDLHPQRFQTWGDLSRYTWKVACAVGLVSIRLFGCTSPASEKYAIALGHALQITNILRDVGEDIANDGRLYLPLEDLARFDYTEENLKNEVYDSRFKSLMRHQAQRAEAYYRQAENIFIDLPEADRQALVPARIMGEIYHGVLDKIREGKYRVFDYRFKLSHARKLAILSKHLIARPFKIE
ncbi:MAG: squalene/phytoene synthase family protein [Luteolibacter sp.]